MPAISMAAPQKHCDRSIGILEFALPACRFDISLTPRGHQTGIGGTAQRLPLYPEIGPHKFMEMTDAPTSARCRRVTDRSVIVISSGPYGHPTRATGVHARRTAILPEAVGRRQRSSAMSAAKPHEAEQELPEGIREPRNVA